MTTVNEDIEGKEHSKGWELSNKWYPKNWSKARLKNLVRKGLLYDWEYTILTGEDYPA